MSDRRLEYGITELVRSRRIPGLRSFHVEAKHGVATIYGSVASTFARRACYETCRHVTGVVHVIDHLQIVS